MGAFKKLGLSEEILRVLEELGFEKPTDIQEQAIPRLLSEDRDMIGIAQTGTGKTAAFGLPLLDRIDPHLNKTQGLILAPTRELGKQIAEQLAIFSKYQERINVLPVYGGAAIYNQIKALKRTQHVIIATPGRLIDLIKRKAVKLDDLAYLILDEADEMLNMGFKEELNEILAYTPDDKQTWLFSATMPNFIRKIVEKYMADPIEIKVDAKNEVNKNIEHLFVAVQQRNKREALTRFLDIQENMRGVVFCRTKRETQELAEMLMKKQYRAGALHGDLSQAQRDRVMQRFKRQELQVLIATDVAARGIDVNDLTHVFHFTLPDDNAYYTHRSGRTARAGKEGTSIAFIGRRELYRINRLERDLGIKFEQVLVPDLESIKGLRLRAFVMNLLESQPKDKIDPELIQEAEMLLANLSKEEIIAKLLAKELKDLNLGKGGDLNETTQKGGDDRDRRGDRRGKRDRDRGGKKKYRGKKSDGHYGKSKKDKKDKKDKGGPGNFKKKKKPRFKKKAKN